MADGTVIVANADDSWTIVVQDTTPTVEVAQAIVGAKGTDGADGTKGADGADGQDGASAYELAVADGFSGTQAEWLASLKGDPGADGADGQDGADGTAATVSVGAVTTGDPGTEATVTNAGTTSAAVLDFTIPRGAPGADGAAGADGSDGADGASAYEVAVAAGFSGTESEWLASLKGDPGADGTDGTNGADGAPGVGVPTGGTSGQVLAKASSTDYDTAWVDQSGGGAAMPERQTTAVTTSSLAAGASEDLSISLALAFRLLQIEVDGPARIRFYATAAARTADADRPIGTDPGLGSGLILEYVAPSAGTYILSPMTFGASMESSPTSAIPLSITNTDTGSATITLTVLWEPDTATAPRNTATATTASLATGSSGDVSLTMAPTYRLLSLATDRPARVRIYATAADRTADAARAVGTDPDDTAGVMLEYVTTADALPMVLSPMVLGASMESTPSDAIPVAVTNNGSTGTVTVTVVWEAAE